MFEGLSLTTYVLMLITLGGVICVAGWRLSAIADTLADRTGMGEAFTGALLLGGATSLSGMSASITAAAGGHAELAVSNAIGGIAAQTAFLAVADVTHRRANLEHAAASAPNIVHASLLIALLAIILLAMMGPDIHFMGVHPASPVLLVVYLFSLRLAQKTRAEPMWRPMLTAQTRVDEPDTENKTKGGSLRSLWLRFAFFALIVAVAGWAVAQAGTGIARETGLTESLVGGLFTALTTSLAELVTSIAAVRQNALTLAVANIMGGNAFDTLFTAASDIVYREGSIYHGASTREAFITALGILMAAVLISGLIRRERHGIANIGYESMVIFVLYALGMVVLGFMG